MFRWRRGGSFSVVEFLVVVAIVGLLAGIMAFSVAGFGRESQTSACESDTRSLRSAEEANYAQVGSYDTEPVLVSHGMLSHVSAWHGVRVVAATPGAPAGNYSITVIGGRCGQNGDQVGQIASDR
jgi:Tfp pilus assembly protein PilE